MRRETETAAGGRETFFLVIGHVAAGCDEASPASIVDPQHAYGQPASAVTLSKVVMVVIGAKSFHLYVSIRVVER